MTQEKLDETWITCKLLRLIQHSDHTDEEKLRMRAVVRMASPLHHDETFYQAVEAGREFDRIDFNEVAREMERSEEMKEFVRVVGIFQEEASNG